MYVRYQRGSMLILCCIAMDPIDNCLKIVSVGTALNSSNYICDGGIHSTHVMRIYIYIHISIR